MRKINTGRDLPVCQVTHCNLRVVEITDHEISYIFNFGTKRTDVLQEWWVVPDNGVCWSEADLKNACLNDLADLQKICLNDEVVWCKITNNIAQVQLPRRIASDFAWNISVQYVTGIGWVISVVCAARAAMDEVLKRKWREPHSELQVV